MTSPVDRAAQALEAEVIRRDEHYGLDNWTFREVAVFVFEHAYKGDTMAKSLEIHPFETHVARARELGFDMLYSEDAPKMMLFPVEPAEGQKQRLTLVGQVSIRLEPVTMRAKEALRRASGDPLCDGYESTSFYEVVDHVQGNINDPLRVAVHDTAVHALTVAEDSLKATSELL